MVARPRTGIHDPPLTSRLCFVGHLSKCADGGDAFLRRKLDCAFVFPKCRAMTTKVPEKRTGSANGKMRALLDTNIWRYVVDTKSEGPLLHLAQSGLYNVQIAPAVVYETLRLEHAPLRASLIRLMTNSRFHRLMPEAYSESMEVLREIERVRPDWLRDTPDLQFFDRLKKDWTRKTGGFWVRCARSPESEARFLGSREGEMREGAKAETQRARREMVEAGWKRNPPMDETFAGTTQFLDGMAMGLKLGGFKRGGL